MKNFKALTTMSLWTLTIGIILYRIEAHLHFREILWALSLSLILLVTHMVNMIIYFKIAGNDPYKWFKN